jgi:hypothetical protein
LPGVDEEIDFKYLAVGDERHVLAIAGSVNTGSFPTSYTYTTTSAGANGEAYITSCSFVNNKGGCQVTSPEYVFSSLCQCRVHNILDWSNFNEYTCWDSSSHRPFLRQSLGLPGICI